MLYISNRGRMLYNCNRGRMLYNSNRGRMLYISDGSHLDERGLTPLHFACSWVFGET